MKNLITWGSRRAEWVFLTGILALAFTGLLLPPAVPMHAAAPHTQTVTYRGAQPTAPPSPTTTPPPLTPPPTFPIGVDIGQTIRDVLITPITTLYQAVTQWLNRENSLMTWTEPTATYQNQAVHDLWLLMLAIVDATLVIILLLSGYEVLVVGGFGGRYATALEVLPRVFLAIIGANVSFAFAGFWLELNNVLCAIMDAQTANQPLPVVDLAAVIPALNVPIALLILVLSLLAVFLGFQMLARLALLVFFIVLLPVLFALLASRRTQSIGQTGIGGYIGAALVQFLQLTCLTIGAKMLLPFLQLHIGPNTTTLAAIFF